MRLTSSVPAPIRRAARLGLMLALLNGVMADDFSEPNQRTWQQADGLPSDEIAALCPDATGYLWVATWSGLVRFDGTRFRAYDTAEGAGPAARGIAALAGDPAGEAVWVAPVAGGLLRFAQGRFQPFALPASHAGQRVARLLVAADGALWLCFEGGEVMRLHAGRPEVFGANAGIPAGRSTQIATDGRGRVWLANGARLLRYEAGALQPVTIEGIGDRIRIASARQDGPWVLSRGEIRKVVGEAVAAPIAIGKDFNAYSVQALLEDSRGALWLGTRVRGVHRITPDGRAAVVLGVPEDIAVLAEDRAGNIWAGSNGDGLVRLRPGVARLYGKAEGLLDNYTLSVCADREGTLWVADRDGGVAFLNAQGRLHTLPSPIADTFVVRSVAPHPAGGIWVATSHGIWRADRSGRLAEEGPEAPADRGQLRVTHADRRGDLWVAFEPARLGRLRAGAWREYTPADGLPADTVQIITEDAAGRIWLGTAASRVYRQAGDRFEEVALGASLAGGIQAMHFDPRDTGWIGSAGGGLYQLGAPPARVLTAAHGLPTSIITQVISDDDGNLWLGSPVGIFRVRRAELDDWFAGRIERVDAALVTRDDGVEPAACSNAHNPSVGRSHTGRLWFATRKGVVEIDPRRDRTDDASLVVQVDELRADGVTLLRGGAGRIPALTRTVDLDYSVLCLSTPDRVQARVRLRGYDEDWQPADRRGPARYTRLPPGGYVFEVAARVAGSPAGEVRLELPLVVAAAWWQTAWFRLGVALALLVLALVLVRLWVQRRLRLQRAELERAAALERERARIARNIHDDLGSGLTRISLLTQTADPGDGRAQLDRIYRTVSGLTQSMDEIVWAVNPKNDHLEGFANYLVEYAQGFLTDAGLRCRVLLPDTLPPRQLPAQFRHHLFLSCKEALNNVAKHAQATEVAVQLRLAGDRVVLELSDNGHGFGPGGAAAPATPVANHDGLTNMRSRLEALGGTCEVVSTPGGTTVTFSAPLPNQTSPA